MRKIKKPKKIKKRGGSVWKHVLVIISSGSVLLFGTIAHSHDLIWRLPALPEKIDPIEW